MSPAPRKSGPNVPWRLIIGAVVIGGSLLAGAISNRGTTQADDIGVGDCFTNPGAGNISRVTNQDCAGPHDVQIYASVSGSSFSFDDFDIEDFDPNDPSSSFPTMSNASEKCDERLLEIMASDHMADPTIIIPEDTLLSEFSDPTERFGGTVLCAIESPSGGLVGSVLP